MILTLYTDASRQSLLMQLEKQEDGTLVIYLPEAVNRVNFLPDEVEMIKQLLES